MTIVFFFIKQYEENVEWIMRKIHRRRVYQFETSEIIGKK
jgi:hypothetical protein